MEDLLSRYERVEKEIEKIKGEAIKVEAELNQHKARIQELKDEAVAMGVDADKLDEVISDLEGKIKALLDNLETKTAEFESKTKERYGR